MPERGRLQRGHPAPRYPHHPDRAVTPGLPGEPGDHFLCVALLDFEVLVHLHSVGVAGAAHVDAHAGVALSRKPEVVHVVARRSGITLAVGDVLENRRNGALRGRRRQPQLGGEAAAIGKRNPHVLNDANRRRRALVWIAHGRMSGISLACMLSRNPQATRGTMSHDRRRPATLLLPILCIGVRDPRMPGFTRPTQTGNGFPATVLHTLAPRGRYGVEGVEREAKTIKKTLLKSDN